MEKSVIIVICFTSLAAWISWLVYNYAVFNKQIAVEAKADYWKSRVNKVQSCIKDLINSIHKQFPKSTITYYHTDDTDEIEGEIRY